MDRNKKDGFNITISGEIRGVPAEYWERKGVLLITASAFMSGVGFGIAIVACFIN